MGFIDFIKGAGAKIFGSDSPAAEQAEKKTILADCLHVTAAKRVITP